MEIVMACDDNYVNLLCCSLCSLLENNKDVFSIRFFLIAEGISDSSIHQLEELVKKYGRKLVLLNPPNFNSKLVVRGRLNKSTYYRLMLADLIPDDVDKVLYLDCDTLIRTSIENLWNIELENNLIAGVLDTTGKFARTSICLDSNAHYVNAGILLINLRLWRKENLQEQFLDFLADRNWNVEFNDQGVINNICRNRIYILNPMYDFMPTYYRYSHAELLRIVQSQSFYDEEQIAKSKENPAIIHYAGYAFSRPWYQGNQSIYKNEFEKYQELSGCQRVELEQPTGIKYKLRKFANNRSNWWSITINKWLDLAYQLFVKMRGVKWQHTLFW